MIILYLQLGSQYKSSVILKTKLNIYVDIGFKKHNIFSIMILFIKKKMDRSARKMLHEYKIDV